MYLSMKDAAEKLGITRQWLWKLIKAGRITTASLAGRDVVVMDAAFRLDEKKRRKH